MLLCVAGTKDGDQTVLSGPGAAGLTPRAAIIEIRPQLVR
jgi:hypothetical protein